MSTAIAESIRIVLMGVTNAGKSSLLNQLFSTQLAIVSDVAGTTTDPVTRKMELLPLGPVAVTDTAGLDDESELGQLRHNKSFEVLGKADVLIFVSPANRPPSLREKQILKKAASYKVPLIMALTHADKEADKEKLSWAEDYRPVLIDNLTGSGIDLLKKRLISLEIQHEPTPLEGLVKEGDSVLLVTPIDLAAPKGRLIMPQVETIRDALDKDCSIMIVKERELYDFYQGLATKPDLVVCDSQAFNKVKADLPLDQALTSFSILFARKKGDIHTYIQGIEALTNVPSGAKVLILESCSHHRQADDIGTVKIPRLFTQLAQSKTDFHFAKSIPDDIDSFHMVIHCGSCMINRREVLNRLELLQSKGVKVTNYGLFLGWANGLYPRALEVLPECRTLSATKSDTWVL